MMDKWTNMSYSKKSKVIRVTSWWLCLFTTQFFQLFCMLQIFHPIKWGKPFYVRHIQTCRCTKVSTVAHSVVTVQVAFYSLLYMFVSVAHSGWPWWQLVHERPSFSSVPVCFPELPQLYRATGKTPQSFPLTRGEGQCSETATCDPRTQAPPHFSPVPLLHLCSNLGSASCQLRTLS
jgi:hypothetical protein